MKRKNEKKYIQCHSIHLRINRSKERLVCMKQVRVCLILLTMCIVRRTLLTYLISIVYIFVCACIYEEELHRRLAAVRPRHTLFHSCMARSSLHLVIHQVHCALKHFTRMTISSTDLRFIKLIHDSDAPFFICMHRSRCNNNIDDNNIDRLYQTTIEYSSFSSIRLWYIYLIVNSAGKQDFLFFQLIIVSELKLFHFRIDHPDYRVFVSILLVPIYTL